MKKLKNILIILILIAIILIITILITNKTHQEVIYEEASGTEGPRETDIRKISFKEYMLISKCLQTYADILNTENSSYYGRNENNEYVKLIEDNEIKNRIYELLSKDFINKNKISVADIYKYVDTFKEKKTTTVLEIYKKTEDGANVMSYVVSAIATSTDDKRNSDEMYLIINLDYKNTTFSVEPLNSLEELERIEIEENQDYIEQNNNNKYYETEITKETIAKEYFSTYKNIMLARPDIAYDCLNQEYKEKRFSTLDSFKNYIDKNEDMIKRIRIEGYETNTYEQSNEYICEDQFGNIYIFNEKQTLDYDVILDLYTIELPQFIEKYDSCNVQERVVLNIEKIKQALNSGDYRYVYSKLADSFKNNKYKTEQEFENYIKGALYNNIDIEYKNFSNEGETYIYDVEIKNLENEEDTIINMQIIMQLKEDRDFVMSFSIK